MKNNKRKTKDVGQINMQKYLFSKYKNDEQIDITNFIFIVRNPKDKDKNENK